MTKEEFLRKFQNKDYKFTTEDAKEIESNNIFICRDTIILEETEYDREWRYIFEINNKFYCFDYLVEFGDDVISEITSDICECIKKEIVVEKFYKI